MKTEKATTISIEILLLNDMLRSKTIDKDIYDEAVKKIISVKSTAPATHNTAKQTA